MLDMSASLTAFRLDCSSVCLLVFAVAIERSWVKHIVFYWGQKKSCFLRLFISTYKICKVCESTVSVGANVMLMNGLPVDVTSLELYYLMDRISAEVTSTQQCLLLSGIPLVSTT